MAEQREFDVVLSFAGTERIYAQALHALLTYNGLQVFLDEEFQHEIWGENLIEYLDRTYRERGVYCLMLLSAEYRRRAYTQVERRAALDRMLNGGVYILPVKVDDAWIDGLPRATAYLDLRQQGVIGVAETLLRKTGGLAPRKNAKVPEGLYVPRVPLGSLPSNQLIEHLIHLCTSQPFVVFGALVFDERHAEYRCLLRDRAYWDALDIASGPSFEVFTIRDCEEIQEATVAWMTALSQGGAGGSRAVWGSKLLKNYFGEPKTLLQYPALVLWVVDDNTIASCRLLPLPRGTVDETFLRLQSLFEKLRDTTSTHQGVSATGHFPLHQALDETLRETEYTVYRQHCPANPRMALRKLGEFLE